MSRNLVGNAPIRIKGELRHRSVSALPPSSPYWDLSQYAGSSSRVVDPSLREAVVVLNYRLPDNSSLYWIANGTKVAADGGLQWLKELDPSLLPNFVVGDFDSTPPSLISEYKSKGSQVIDGRHDQDSSDLEKALLVLEVDEISKASSHDRILILGGLGGNLSHQFANINVLYKYRHRQIVLIGRENVAILLSSSPTKIKFSSATKRTVYCSLVPVGQEVREVTTQGLKWNLNGDKLGFGSLVSTSNEFKSEIVEISASQPLLFIVDLKH